MTMDGKVTIGIDAQVRDGLRQFCERQAEHLQELGIPNKRPGPYRVSMSEGIAVLLEMYVEEHGGVKKL